jgi:hypothetical protein
VFYPLPYPNIDHQDSKVIYRLRLAFVAEILAIVPLINTKKINEGKMKLKIEYPLSIALAKKASADPPSMTQLDINTHQGIRPPEIPLNILPRR